jgi:ABC-type polysaccharide/polyol phosphate export permease
MGKSKEYLALLIYSIISLLAMAILLGVLVDMVLHGKWDNANEQLISGLFMWFLFSGLFAVDRCRIIKNRE